MFSNLRCERCDHKFQDGDVFFNTKGEIVCDVCIDSVLEELKEEWIEWYDLTGYIADTQYDESKIDDDEE